MIESRFSRSAFAVSLGLIAVAAFAWAAEPGLAAKPVPLPIRWRSSQR